jgi:hypothetical protein
MIPTGSSSLPDSEAVNFPDHLIRQHVPDLSFVDVGALWLTRNEKVSVAMLAGAKSASVIDATPPGDPAWDRCREHCQALGVSGYAEYSHDLNDPLIHQTIGTFDFVYCSGVIYHVPSVFFTLERLFSLTRRYLMLVSMVVPEKIENEFGSLNLAGGGMLFVPGLNDETRSIVSAYFERMDLEIMHITPTKFTAQPFMWGPGEPNYGPWWWLFPPETLCSLVETVGFKILAKNPGWGGRNVTLFCEK